MAITVNNSTVSASDALNSTVTISWSGKNSSTSTVVYALVIQGTTVASGSTTYSGATTGSVNITINSKIVFFIDVDVFNIIFKKVF